MLEEVDELKYAVSIIDANVNLLWDRVKGNYDDLAEPECERIYNFAIESAVEAIQVAAMAEKFMDSMKGIKRVES